MLQPLLISIILILMEFKVFYLNHVQVAVVRPMSVSQKNEDPLERLLLELFVSWEYGHQIEIDAAYHICFILYIIIDPPNTWLEPPKQGPWIFKGFKRTSLSLLTIKPACLLDDKEMTCVFKELLCPHPFNFTLDTRISTRDTEPGIIDFTILLLKIDSLILNIHKNLVVR